jgi:calcium-dependent protein kinase
LAQQFQALDKDGEGYISYSEIREALIKIRGFNVNEEEVKQIIKQVDADDNGKINYTEFLMVSMNREQMLS